MEAGMVRWFDIAGMRCVVTSEEDDYVWFEPPSDELDPFDEFELWARAERLVYVDGHYPDDIVARRQDRGSILLAADIVLLRDWWHRLSEDQRCVIRAFMQINGIGAMWVGSCQPIGPNLPPRPLP